MSGVVADQHISVKSENNITRDQETIAAEDTIDYDKINKPTPFTHVTVDRIKCELDDVNEGITDQDNISTELETNSNMGCGTITTKELVLRGIKKENNDVVNRDMMNTKNKINNDLESGSTTTQEFLTVNIKLENIQEDTDEEFTNTPMLFDSPLPTNHGNKCVEVEIEGMMNKHGATERQTNTAVKQEYLYLDDDRCLDNGVLSLEIVEKAGSSTSRMQQMIDTGQEPSVNYGLSNSEISLSRIKAETTTGHIKVYSARKQYPCNICNKIFYSKTNLTIHMSVHSTKQFNTQTDNKHTNKSKVVLKTESNVSNHAIIVLNNKPIYMVTKPNSSSKNVTKNTIEDTCIKLYKCDLCKKVFVNKNNLISHMSKHAYARQFLCELCSRTFKNKSTHKRHMMSHTGEKPFSCDICHKEFSIKGNLKCHMLTHSEEKPFLCGICHKTFSQKPLLKCHMKIHSEVKPYSCDMCHRAFIRKDTLKCHITTHSKQKPFKCGVCRKKFSQKPHLKYHIMRTHSKEKPFSCEICNKSFSIQSSLKSHMKVHLRKKPFPLEISAE